jgi:hypothetical protein
VRSVDPETYAVELEDGSKFGIQHVEDGTVFFGEHEPAKTGEKTNSETMKPGRGIPSGSGPTGEAAPHPGFLASELNTPTLRPGENQGDLLSKQTEDLSLVGEKGIDYGARAAEELRKTQAAEAAAPPPGSSNRISSALPCSRSWGSPAKTWARSAPSRMARPRPRC